MLKYAVLLLDDESVSYCSYENKQLCNVISAPLLESAVKWAMKENLEIQFVFPNHLLSQEILGIIDSVSHIKIMGCHCPYIKHADIIVIDAKGDLPIVDWREDGTYILRLSFHELEDALDVITRVEVAPNRINVIIKDRDLFKKDDIEKYEASLNRFSGFLVEKGLRQNKLVQSNLLTDRLFLNEMNNCNAGHESITIAPNGSFYICPAFYYDGDNSCGNSKTGLFIRNKYLFQLDHAPICSHCDAYQCMRCVWMNRKATHEVNTPSQGQCYSSHIERKASENLLKVLREKGLFIEGLVEDIVDLDYIDPFDNRFNWN